MKKITIYTDGACSGNPGPGGWGVIIIDHRGEETLLYGGEDLTTNNKMELLAVINALGHLGDEKHEILLCLDSNYVKQGITEWIFSWKKNGWITSSKTPVKNKDLWIALDNLSNKHKIKWLWVKAHNGEKYNELVDKLAKSQIKRNFN